MAFYLFCTLCKERVAQIVQEPRNEGVQENRPVLLEAGCEDKTHLGCGRGRHFVREE